MKIFSGFVIMLGAVGATYGQSTSTNSWTSSASTSTSTAIATMSMPSMPMPSATSTASGGGMNMPTNYPPAPPRTIGYLLYPGFAALDVFGPIEFINILSTFHNVTLSLITTGADLTPVSTKSASHSMAGSAGGMPGMTMSTLDAVGESVVPTHTLANAPKLDILIVPGGMGARTQVNNTQLLDFLKTRVPELEYFLTVCTGAAIAAKAGVLDGKKATGTKFSWAFITSQSDKVQWVPRARWVEDGKTWTSSGVTAGKHFLSFASASSVSSCTIQQWT
ncbi:class I glutamine amidotransferase-like protein [Phlyctochytrium arcticum]|nr:class I glutamine amidotransferase-like protein [Phlyctochytrium arcticum]